MNILMIDSPQVSYLDSEDTYWHRYPACRFRITAQPTPEQLAWAEGVIAFHGVAVDPVMVTALKQCRVLVKATIGVDEVDVEALAQRDIGFSNLAAVGVEEVAEHTLALVLYAQRRLGAFARHTRAGGWNWRAHEGAMKPCRETVLGLLGYGKTGQAVAARASALNYRVIFHDPLMGRADPGFAHSRTFDALLAEADILSLHLPLTEQTRGLMNDEQFARMKPGASLVNTARGAIVDSRSLLRALNCGQLSQALLDVEADEPAVPAELRAHERVLLTPHAAFYSQSSLADLKHQAVERLLALDATREAGTHD